MSAKPSKLSKRESELMEAVYTLGQASATEIEAFLANPPSNAAIRTLLGILVNKGHLTFQKEGRRFIYQPTVARQKAGRHALKETVATFFDGSISQAVAGLLSHQNKPIPAQELEKLEQLIAQAKQQETQS